ncbi:acetylglutamate synthase [Colletotrichum plurivorum]|uniref:Amino-acid acetyltransferase, mitochondrial n=1 Tax=Colletotrichum plurivorum TaxID=2175906 RepID=A0A8H6NSS0_9PEZI|nr:acetylglutamate synthase [Colletotrichum plurivorum]
MRTPFLKHAGSLVTKVRVAYLYRLLPSTGLLLTSSFQAPFAVDSLSPPNCKLYHRPRSGSTRQDEALQVALSAVRHSSNSEAREKKRAEDRLQDFIVSVLEASATRRDAKGYLQKYALQSGEGTSKKARTPQSRTAPDHAYSSIRVVNQAPKFIQGDLKSESAVPLDEPVNLAIVKMTHPQDLDDKMLSAIAKTFSQLRKLGLVSLIVLDIGPAPRGVLREQSWRVQQAIESFGEPGSILLDRCVAETEVHAAKTQGFMPSSVYVQHPHLVLRALQENAIVVIPPVTLAPDMKSVEVVDADEAIVALTKFFCGLQLSEAHSPAEAAAASFRAGVKVASVEKVIILDPAGGTPLADEHNSCHRYINLEQEFEGIMYGLTHPSGSEARRGKLPPIVRQQHARNLQLAKNVLSMLPSTSSAIISTPSAAANKPIQEFTSVTTRNRQNPLIHNLLTDKPVFSSSLPIERVRSGKGGDPVSGETHLATLIKRGMPLTVYPDPTISAWLPPRPGAPRLRLTDTCIDLPRLVHLINDSFNRELDVQHYLDRVNESLAGVIIAGEYEGGAILTWEKPFGLDEETAYKTGRLVPYLDKFAVLKSRQGSGGVADVVFNAMVRGCFPEGVCWRSRQDNPVNKWYFERSLGTWKLKDTNWTMFWTTPDLPLGDPKLLDYENVCRHIEPSWADSKPPD